MFFLDSCEVEWIDPGESSAHHLKEIKCVKSLLNEKTIVVVDDSPTMCFLSQVEGQENKFEAIEQLYWRKRFFSSQICNIYGSKIIFFALSTCMDGF